MRQISKKRGFTIVELVIVIAVIAVLAAVLIPTFSNLVKKSHVSVDRQLVYHINEAVAIHEAENGKPATAYEAIKATELLGFTIERLTPTTEGYDIVWDSLTNRYALLNEKGKVVYEDENKPYTPGVTAWKVYGTMPTVEEQKANGYSVYLKGTDKTGTVDVVNGFDPGDNLGIQVINYAGSANAAEAKTVVLRSNSIGTAVKVNAPEDVILCYGTAGNLKVEECAMQSLHIQKDCVIPFVEIAKGRIALEAGAKVEKLHFDAKTEEEFDNIIVAADPSVTLPEFSRDEVVIGEDGTLVVELQKDTKNDSNTESDYVYLYKQGVISQIVVTEEKVDGIHKNEEDNKFYGYTKDATTEVKTNVEEVKLGVTEKAPETQKAAVEIANNYSGNNTSGSITVGEETVELPKLDQNGDVEIIEGVNTADIAAALTEKTGETKTVADVLTADVADIAIAVAENLDDSKKPEELQGKNAEEVELVVNEVVVEEKGISEEQKEIMILEEKAKKCTHIQFNEATQRLYINCPICGIEFGTETLPYQLHDAAEFEGFIKLYDWEGYPGYYQVYRDNGNDYIYAELANDIDCSTVNWPEGYSNAYYLIFDGKGHKLSNINNPEGSLFNYVYYWMDIENITFENCSMYCFVKYPYYGYYHDNGGYTDFYCYNLKFYDCTFYDAMFDYAYDCIITMEDCVLDGCVNAVGCSLISYGGYSAKGLSTGFVFDNVDIKNSEAYGGAYIYYGGSKDFPITFKDCDVTNTGVYGGQGMALGGFVGNASTSTVSFDSCSFDGEIVSASATAAGFIGQPSTAAGKISITNSYISEGTKIVNKGGTSVCAFAGSGTFNKDGNRFLGTLSSTAASKTSSNGFEGFNYVKHTTLATKDDFTFDLTTGELKYIGNGTFDKITVREQVGIDNIGAGLGGYSWVFDLQDTENVTKDTSLGYYKVVRAFKQVVEEDYEGELPFMTTDKYYLDEAKKVAGNGLYFSNGVLAIDSQIYNSGSQFIFGGCSDVDNIPSTKTIKLEILLIVGESIEGSVTLTYNVSLD